MISISATEVKNKFGQILEKVIVQPITVEKTGRPVAIIMSVDEYERLQHLEDHYWGERAREAEKTGFIGVEDSARLLRELWDAKS